EDGVERWYFSTQRTGLFGVSFTLINALRRNVAGFDLAHIHSLYRFPSTIAAHYCRRFDVPYIVRPHGTLDPFIYHRHRLRKIVYERLIENRNLERAAAVHFTAAEEMSLAQSLGLKFRGVVVPLGVELPPPSASREELRAAFAGEWPQTRDKRIILFLGRLTQKKGLDLLVKAFGRLARARDDVHLFLAGPDDEGYGANVRQWLKDEGVAERATFAGMLEGARKEAALAAADVFVLSSYSENFGIAVIEALAAGVPAVISNKINIWRELHDADAAVVVNCNVDEVTAAISKVLDDAALARRLAAAGKKIVAEQFTWPIVADRMIAVYREIAAGNAKSSPFARSAA
ncbi:MAG TPA: glycosyltransferase, partial [Candidatus Binataceae bacterium]|nr:glycosyltransferase [Candidatus Binataceae bacterium]